MGVVPGMVMQGMVIASRVGQREDKKTGDGQHSKKVSAFTLARSPLKSRT